MGVDLATFRVRIGGFASVLPRMHARLVYKWKKTFMTTVCPTDRPGKVFILSLILVLLLRGGVEPNPGPQITRTHHKHKVSLAMPRRRSELKGLTTQPKRIKTELALIMSAMKNFYRKPPINVNINKVVFQSDVSAQRDQASGTANSAVTEDRVHNVQRNVLHEAVQDQYDLQASLQPDDLCPSDDDHSLFEKRNVLPVSIESGQHSYQKNDRQARGGQTQTDLATHCGTDGTDLSGFGLGASVRNDDACLPEDDKEKANREEDSGDCCDSSINQVKYNTQKEEKSLVYFDSNPPKDEPSKGENISVEVEELARLVSMTTQDQSSVDDQTETGSSHEDVAGHARQQTSANSSANKGEASTGTGDCSDNQVPENAVDCENVETNEAECFHVVVQSDQDSHCDGRKSQQATQATPTQHCDYRDMGSQTEPDNTAHNQPPARTMEMEHTERSSEINPLNIDLTTEPEVAATLPKKDKPCLVVLHTDPVLTAFPPQSIQILSRDGVCTQTDSENSGTHNHPEKPDCVQCPAINSAESQDVDDDSSESTENRENEESYPGHSKASCCNSPNEQSDIIPSDSKTEPTFSANQIRSCPGQSSYTELTSAQPPAGPSQASHSRQSTTQLPSDPSQASHSGQSISTSQPPGDPSQASHSRQSTSQQPGDPSQASHSGQSTTQPPRDPSQASHSGQSTTQPPGDPSQACHSGQSTSQPPGNLSQASHSRQSTIQPPSDPSQASHSGQSTTQPPSDPSRPSNPELSTTQSPNPCESIAQSSSDPSQSSDSPQSSRDSSLSSQARQSTAEAAHRPQQSSHSAQPRIDPSQPAHMRRPTRESRCDPNSSSSLKTEAAFSSNPESLTRVKRPFCERCEHSVSQSQPGSSEASSPIQPTHQFHHDAGQVTQPTESANRPCEHRQSAYYATLTALRPLFSCLVRFVALFLDSLQEAAAEIERLFPNVWHRVQRLRRLPSGPHLTTQADSRGPQQSLRCPDVQQELLSPISQTHGQNIQHVDTAHRPSSAPDSLSELLATGGTTNNRGSHLCPFSGTGSWVDCGTDPPECPTASPHPDHGTESWVDCGTDPLECSTASPRPDHGTQSWVDCGTDPPKCPTASPHPDHGTESWVDCDIDPPECPTASPHPDHGTESWVDCDIDPPECPTASQHPDHGTESWVDCGTDPTECPTASPPVDHGTAHGHDEPFGSDEDLPYPTRCTEDLNSAEGQTALGGSDAEERMGANTYPLVTERIQFQLQGPHISLVAQEDTRSLDSDDELEGETFDLGNDATSWVSEVTSRDDAELVTSTEYLVMGFNHEHPSTQLLVQNAYSVHDDDWFLDFPDPENVSS
ncbi:serine-rich adhesin for platelets-like [Littorina saxatilis]|uniref:serine-rich adhesin for platelets-like n=1 Tax=Littorina saxatilis TaxID=31220 RepID=UPI0038B42305